MSRLLNEFLTQDCDSSVRDKLLSEIQRHGAAKLEIVREFNFNRYNVHLNFHSRVVSIEDELDTSEQGSCAVSLDEFASALAQHKPGI